MCAARYVGTKGRMDPDDENRIRRHFTYITEEIEAGELVDSLWAKYVISRDDVDEVKHLRAKRDRNRALIHVLLNRGRAACAEFLGVLKAKGYPHVAEKLEQDTANDKRAEEPLGDIFRQLSNIRMSLEQEKESRTNQPNETIHESEVNLLRGQLRDKEKDLQEQINIVKQHEATIEDKVSEIERLRETLRTTNAEQASDIRICVLMNKDKKGRLIYNKAKIKS